MRRAWKRILYRYGQDVVLNRGGERRRVKALIQPVLDKSREQEEPSPLGVGRQEQFLYLGAVEQPMDTDTVVEWQGGRYRVKRTHVAGVEVCPYRWALLCPRDEVGL